MKTSKKLIAGAALLLSSTLAYSDQDDAVAALALARAQFSVEQAIEKVHSNYAGQIVEIELDDHKGKSVYEIKIVDLAGEQKQELLLSLDSGEVVKTQTSGLKVLGIQKLDEDERSAIRSIQESDFSIIDTVKQLESSLNGKVVEMELDNEKGITFYKFELMTDQGKRKVIVDAQTGQQIPMTHHD